MMQCRALCLGQKGAREDCKRQHELVHGAIKPSMAALVARCSASHNLLTWEPETAEWCPTCIGLQQAWSGVEGVPNMARARAQVAAERGVLPTVCLRKLAHVIQEIKPSSQGPFELLRLSLCPLRLLDRRLRHQL